MSRPMQVRRVAVSLFMATSFLFMACNDENSAHDDNRRPEINSAKLPGNQQPMDYNVTPTLRTGTPGPNEALYYPVAPQDTVGQWSQHQQHQTGVRAQQQQGVRAVDEPQLLQTEQQRRLTESRGTTSSDNHGAGAQQGNQGDNRNNP